MREAESRARSRNVVAFEEAALEMEERAHDGDGSILTARARGRAEGSRLAFVDLTEIPPGASIGVHAHGVDEEVYVIIAGEGTVTLGEEQHRVRPGTVVVNPCGGRHGLRNTGLVPLRLVVIDVDGCNEVLEGGE